MRVAGFHPIEAALRRGRKAEGLLVARSTKRIQALIVLARGRGVPVRNVSMEELDRHCPADQHRGVLLLLRGDADAPAPQERDLGSIVKNAAQDSLVILLDGVTDPHNLGAILRSSDLFGADAVIVPRRRSAGGLTSSQTVRSASAGASEWVPLLEVANLVHAVKDLQRAGYWVYGADVSGGSVDGVALQGRLGVVLGREGEGLHDLVKRSCDGLIKIPTAGHIDSLNVSVAAGVIMYEIRRQQRAGVSP